MIIKKSKTLRSFRLSQTKKQKVSNGGFFCKNKVKKAKVKQWFIGKIIGVFWKFFYVSLYIPSKSGDYSTKLPNFRKDIELPPPVLWCSKKHGINRVNDHLLSQCKYTVWFNLEGSVVAKACPKYSKKQHLFVVPA